MKSTAYCTHFNYVKPLEAELERFSGEKFGRHVIFLKSKVKGHLKLGISPPNPQLISSEINFITCKTISVCPASRSGKLMNFDGIKMIILDKDL